MNTQQSLVSVIIPTKNSAYVLEACLRSIAQQSYTNIEIIVVDNFSTDATIAIAKKYNCNILCKGPERSIQKNAGAKLAKGMYCLFIDSDMELQPNVIQECLQQIAQNPKILAVIIPEVSFGIGFWATCKQFERSHYTNIPWLQSPRFFNKETFTSLHGFYEELIGAEDFEIQNRIIKQFGSSAISRIASKIMHNEGRLQLFSLLKKKYYYGKTMVPYVQRKENKQYISKQSNPIYRLAILFSDKKAIADHPIIFLGTCYMKCLELSALGIGYVIQW